MPEKLLNVGSGTHYAKGWLNIDVWEDETTRPDIVVTPGEPYPFDDNSIDAIYLGHVLEHIPWPDVQAFLYDMRRIAKPGAPILIVGPDVYRTLERWANGQEPWYMVESVLEHQELHPGDGVEWWDGATHHWNCHLQRVMNAVHNVGFANIEDYTDVIPNDVGAKWWQEPHGQKWPVVGKWHWQFAIKCEAP